MDFVEQWKTQREAAYARPRVKCHVCMTVDCIDWQDEEKPICEGCHKSNELREEAEAKQKAELALREAWWADNGLAHNRHNTFQTFDVLPSNKTAFEAIKASVGASKGVFLRGLFGCGKTHLMYGLIHELLRSGKHVKFVRCGDIVKEIRDNYGRSELIENCKDADYLILDDFTFTKDTPGIIRQPLNDLLDFRWQRMLWTSFTSNAGNENVTITEALGGQASSRIEGLCGRPVDIAGPDRRRVKV